MQRAANDLSVVQFTLETSHVGHGDRDAIREHCTAMDLDHTQGSASGLTTVAVQCMSASPPRVHPCMAMHTCRFDHARGLPLRPQEELSQDVAQLDVARSCSSAQVLE